MTNTPNISSSEQSTIHNISFDLCTQDDNCNVGGYGVWAAAFSGISEDENTACTELGIAYQARMRNINSRTFPLQRMKIPLKHLFPLLRNGLPNT
jgi:hypothetical protein